MGRRRTGAHKTGNEACRSSKIEPPTQIKMRRATKNGERRTQKIDEEGGSRHRENSSSEGNASSAGIMA